MTSSKAIRNGLMKATLSALKSSVVAFFYRLQMIIEVVTDLVTLISMEVWGLKVI